jgi:hypothetical protein
MIVGDTRQGGIDRFEPRDFFAGQYSVKRDGGAEDRVALRQNSLQSSVFSRQS